ncbi:FkbM family methyltransferase [Nitratireductor indicus C115]|uniref:FkbM family methyltransferase n=1 Tax=Nitratireductor indicus C115 TaxID=1231190 RepID=K2PJF8_9HYPH|nr:FkbM family methyltransferase [Nitratireductor indicus]EKF41297.1 FkbM family methyltransferase [Nitratireductor indicus C115]SFQ65599.1 methyltransferase, FkbM family [Nitratireductor indicus]
MTGFNRISIDGAEYLIALPNQETDYIQKKIVEEEQPYELPMLRDIAKRVRPDGLVLDIGANVGNHTLYLAAVVGCSVHAFEPNASLCEALNLSVEANELSKKVEVHCVGLGREPAKAHFGHTDESNLGGQSLAIGSDEGDIIDVMRLDDLIFDRPVEAMKIDVEGMEIDVLEGASELVRRDRPLLYVECLNEQDFQNIRDWLEPFDYCYWDTFNATPTHLFVRGESVTEAQRIDRLMTKLVREGYQREERIHSLRSQLDQANKKYHDAVEQVSVLKQRFHDANLKYREVSERQQSMKREVELQKTIREKDLQLVSERSDAQKKLFEERLEELQRGKALVEAQLKEVLTQHQGTQEKALDIEASSAQVMRELNERQAEIRGLRDELTVANRRYDETVQLNASLKAEIEVRRSSHQEELTAADRHAEAQRSMFETELARLGDENAELETRMQEVDEKREAAEAALRELEQTHDDADRELVELRSQLEALKAELAESHDKYRLQAQEFEQLKRSLEAEREAFHQERADQQERQRAQSALLESSVTQARTEASVAEKRLRDQLHATNLKYRKVTQQLDKVRRSRAFEAATHLKQARQSWKSAVKLPWRLLKLTRSNRSGASGKAILASEADRNEPVAPVVLSTNFAERITDIPQKKLRMACIMDDFTFQSYQPECELFALTPDAWLEELEGFRPDMLFIEAAWRGKDELWGSKVGHTSQELKGIVQWCRERKIPTAFWNKEDPVHFETFLNTARLFDLVFTTDMDCIHRYKAALGHERVYLLPFACQPKVNNPIEKYERRDAFCFAGAYYVRYPERTRDLGNFVSHLSQYRPLEIYDRNLGKDHPDYKFPDEYQSFIVGNLPFEQIDKAYKGYRYAINLNSIKQSQTMFARRVYELLASNTITISNYSRGVRLLFGDLVITSDDGAEIIRRLEQLDSDEYRLRKFRLAGLRKVMSEHTYQDRLSYVLSKVNEARAPQRLPEVLVTGHANTQAEADALLSHFNRQTYDRKRLLLAVPRSLRRRIPAGQNVTVVNASDKRGLGEIAAGSEWIAGMVAGDFYGTNYLTDLVLATRYSDALAIGKGTCFSWKRESAELQAPDAALEYKFVPQLRYRSAIVHMTRIADLSFNAFTSDLADGEIEEVGALSIDAFNYCRDGNIEGAEREAIENTVSDLADLDVGLPLADLVTRVEGIEAEVQSEDEAPVLSGAELAGFFKSPANKPYRLSVEGAGWVVSSSLPDGKHDYLYAAQDVTPEELDFNDLALFHLDVTPGLNLQMVLLFLDANKQRIAAEVRPSNRNHSVRIPEGTAFIRMGLRIYGNGDATINGLVLGARRLHPAEVVGRSKYLLLTNHYPSYSDLYRNGFVHSRVKAYKDRGVDVDVFRLRKGEALGYHEFQDVDVITGSQEALETLLKKGDYRHVLVHFLDPDMWTVLKNHIDKVKVTVWVHGAEVQPWHRREYNYTDSVALEKAKQESEKRMSFWRHVLQDMHENLSLVFVSNYFAEEVISDVGVNIDKDKYRVINNPINTNLFDYVEKDESHRKKVLSIRPFASRKYANDLTVEAIVYLKDKPWFNDMDFHIVGDGALFEETLRPLQGVENVKIERRFLSQNEIASLHKEYGIFLTPTRMDAQGVSRDEAMSSGLVPITNSVAAIPEFVDEDCGVLVPAEDARAMANGIERLFENPDLFVSLSRGAAARVRNQSAQKIVVEQELSQFIE